MWRDESHLPAWPSSPANGVTTRTFRAAWRAVDGWFAMRRREAIAFDTWVGGTYDQERSSRF